MQPTLHDIIRTWATEQSIALTTGKDADDPLTRLWLLEGGYLAGEIRLIKLQPDPPSFQITAMRGNMVLDESWSDFKGLSTFLSVALSMLQKRVKTEAPQWHLHLGDLPE